MKSAIVITCSREPLAWLEQAVQSVLDQTATTRPVIVSDGPLAPDVQAALLHMSDGRADWIQSGSPHHDAGDWARCAGALHAVTAGYAAVGFLDGDNWLETAHVEKMLALDVDVATCARFIRHIGDDRVLHVHPDECDGVRHVDTSCFLLRRRAFGLLAYWALIPRELSVVCDRLFWGCAKAAVDQGHLTHAHSPMPTVNFRSRYAVHYERLGLEPPPGSKPKIPLPTGFHRIPWPFEQEISVDQ